VAPNRRSTFRDKEAKPDPVKSSAPRVAVSETDPVMSMAVRFEELAYENRVSLDGKQARYLAKMFQRPVELSGILGMKVRDENGKPVPAGRLCRMVVRMFWNRAPWDREGDVAYQFADPVSFEDCLKAVVDRWTNLRLHNEHIKRRNTNV
jgi:hypothetical protein